MAHFFIFKGVGITAFGIPFILTIFGLKCAFKIKTLPLIKTTKSTFIIMSWSVLFLSALFKKSELNPGGALGYQIYTWLEFLVGHFGVLFILLFSAFLISRLSFNFRIEFLIQKAIQYKNPIISLNILKDDTVRYLDDIHWKFEKGEHAIKFDIYGRLLDEQKKLF